MKEKGKREAENPHSIERVLDGSKITDSKSFSFEFTPFSVSMLVKRGHEECGDSAFSYCDKEKLIIGVFDGVSGEPGASIASSDAARSVLKSLKTKNKAGEKDLLEALAKADCEIKKGYTTALVFFVERTSGEFVIANIGDSVAYTRDKNGDVALELPISRVVRNGDSVMRFFTYRNLVTSVLGKGNPNNEAQLSGTQSESPDVSICSGKMGKGDFFILASDALPDNLHIKTKEGIVVDASGIDDLKSLIDGETEPEKIVKKLEAMLRMRIDKGRAERENEILVPKEDDLTIAVVSRL